MRALPTSGIPALALTLAALGFLAVPGAAAADGGPWDAFQFLLGDWVGGGSGQPGQGSGEFSFRPDLQGKILVRRHRAELPAGQGGPARVHEDLMVVYPGAGPAPARAMYFDNEGHVIRYAVRPATDPAGLVFTSDVEPSAPRFRLTYTKTSGETVSIRFEVAPPGKPEEFRSYLEGTARKKAAKNP